MRGLCRLTTATAAFAASFAGGQGGSSLAQIITPKSHPDHKSARNVAIPVTSILTSQAALLAMGANNRNPLYFAATTAGMAALKLVDGPGNYFQDSITASRKDLYCQR